MLPDGTTTINHGSDAIDRRLTAWGNNPASRWAFTVLLLLAWPVLSLILILMKLSGSLALSWALILAPIWFPLMLMACILLGAMWLDQLSTNRHQ